MHGAAGFQKRVALKLLDRDKTPGALANEARLGGLLRHANLVETYALEEVEGTWVCAMELVLGGSLRDLLPLPPRAVIDVGLQVCRGLQHAHDQIGLVHLDLKPDNLLVDQGTVKVADLGIAVARGFSGDGRVRGTPGYMPPEQWAGIAVDPRADVFALGVTLIELATGEVGHEPDDVPWLSAVLSRCLARDRTERFASMIELAEALNALDPEGAGLAELLGQRSPVPAWNPRSSSRSADTWTLDPSVDNRPRTNLTASPDRFVGRTADVDSLIGRLDQPGLYTVKGAGGLGKTRLARRSARLWQEGGKRQGWFVDLAPARTPTDAMLAVATALGVPIAIGDEGKLAERLGHAIAGRGPVVMVLDNFEQLDQGAGLVATWRDLAPEARFLVTSRSALRLPGEVVIELDPLGPEDAVALLVQRASERGVDIAGDPSLGALAERLDGIPLALELAAGRLGLMSARAILERLDQRFKLLRSSRRGALERQATLRGALDWSWDLLDPAERAAFAQCGAFAGGFSIEAAEAVLELPPGAWALDVVDALIARSLITERDGRLRLFETARLYALDKLDDPEAVYRRHGEWFARYGDADARHIGALGSSDAEVQARPWLDDIAVACRRALDREDRAVAVSTATAAWWVLEVSGPYSVGAELLDRAHALGGHDPADAHVLARLRAHAADLIGQPDVAMERYAEAEALARTDLERGRVLAYRATLRFRRGQPQGAREELTEALELLDSVEGAFGARASVCNALARVAAMAGDWDVAQGFLERATTEARHGNEPRYLGVALSNLGKIEADRGHHDRAREAYTAALQQHARRGDVRHEAIILGNLGLLEADRGRMEQAIAMLEGAVGLYQQLGDRRLAGTALCNFGNVSADLGRNETAESSFTEAIAIFDAHDDQVWGGIARGFLARLRFKQGRPDEAVLLIDQAIAMTERRMPLAWASFLALRGEIRDDAEDLDLADATMRKGGWRRDHVGVRCARARFEARRGNHEAAEAQMAAADEAARELGMHPEAPMGREIAHARAVLGQT